MMMHQNSLLTELAIPPFAPLPLLRNPHMQTIVGTFGWHGTGLEAEGIYHIPLSDDDAMVVMENTPAAWQPQSRIVVLVHGLTGCYESGYIRRLARLFYERGHKVMRVNLRGCGPGFGHARRPYHSGRSEDTRALLEWLAARYPAAPVTQVGFSLGGNITLKMAGEDAASPTGRLDSVIAVSPPAHLAACAKKLARRENWIFDYYFVRKLRQQVARLQVHYPDMLAPAFPQKMALRDFDEHFTAPYSGFKDADDYYEQSSSLPLLAHIKVPALILSAMDDPVIDTEQLQGAPLGPHTDLVLTPAGGHVGFLGKSARGYGVRWMDSLIVRWVERHHQRSATNR